MDVATAWENTPGWISGAVLLPEVWIAVGTFLVAVATGWLAVEAGKHARRMRETNELAAREQEWKNTPVVEAWLQGTENELTRGSVALLWLVLQNVGGGAARNVRWWFEDVDEEQWKQRRIGGAYWPDSEEAAAGQRILPAGGRIQLIMTGGRSLTVAPGTADYDWEKHEPVHPFKIRVSYENLAGERTEREPIRLDPRPLYRRGGGETSSPLSQIAEILKKHTGVSLGIGAEHPAGGVPARFRGTERDPVQAAKFDQSRADIVSELRGVGGKDPAEGPGP